MTPPIKRVLGIDSSTQGIAWCVVKNGKPEAWGKIRLDKLSGMQNKLKVVAEEYPKILQKYKPHHVYIEKTISVRNAATFRVLSYVVGALMITTLANNYECFDVEPGTWKVWYGYTNLSRKFTTRATLKLGKLQASKFCNIMRKSQTQRVHAANFPAFDGWEDHDISDAAGIALYGYEQKFAKLKLKKTKEIALDLQELKRLGLDGIL